jgi:hypothetical protein
MVIAALLVGVITWYYFGRDRGTIAAAVAAGLFLLARMVPSLAVPAYLIVAGGLLFVFAVGPKAQSRDGTGAAARAAELRAVAARIRKRLGL